MNERIQQLAEQARKEFLELPTGYRPEQIEVRWWFGFEF